MSALGSARRQRTTVMLAINLVALLALGGMGFAGYTALKNYTGATKVGREFIAIPATPVGMLGIVDGDDRLTSLALLVLKPDAQTGGTIVPVPVTADSTLGVGDERIPLAGVYADGGAEALAVAVESTLSITLDVAMVATPAEAEALLQAVSPVQATFGSEVQGTLDGSELTLYDAGENTLSATQAVQVLTATVPGQTDRQRRANVEAVWAGVAAAVGEGVSTPAADAPVASLADLAAKLFAAHVDSRVLPADPVDPAAAPEGVDVESLDRAEAIWVLATIAPKSMSAPAPGLVFRIEAPPGYEARVKFAIKALLFLGANVSSVHLQGPVQEATVYLISDPRVAAQAESSNELFGIFEVAEPPLPTEGIDVVLQLGTDFLTGEGETLPTTTTTSTEPA